MKTLKKEITEMEVGEMISMRRDVAELLFVDEKDKKSQVEIVEIVEREGRRPLIYIETASGMRHRVHLDAFYFPPGDWSLWMKKILCPESDPPLTTEKRLLMALS